MAWSNAPIALYHGTDHGSAQAILANGVELKQCRALTDFGRGFYLTASGHQAEQWANVRTRKLLKGGAAASAAILEYRINRNALAELASLVFVLDSTAPDFWDFVSWCRARTVLTHACRLTRQGQIDIYDLVVGPVTLWEQLLVIKDADQWSFHTDEALAVLPSVNRVGDGAALRRPQAGALF